MEIKSVLRFAGLVLSPACACLMIAAGCTTESEIPLPPGAYVPPPEKQIPLENSALSSDPMPGPSSRGNAAFPVDPDTPEFTREEITEGTAPRSATARKTEAKKTGPVFAKDDIIYTIRKNDTLGGIANRHGMTAAALADYNGISVKSKIYPGKTLHIPAGMKSPAAAKASNAGAKSSSTGAKASTASIPAGATVYVVQSGDTLGGIAQKHSVRTADLVAANDLDVRKPIRTGQKLIIPAGAKPAAAAPAKTTTPAKKSSAAPAKTATPAKPAAAAAPAKATPAKKSATKPAPTGTAAPAKGQEPAPAVPQSSADDLLKGIGSESQGQAAAPAEPAPQPAKPAPAAAAPAAPGSVAVPPAKEEAFDDDNSIMVNIEREMTLEETAKAFDRSYETVKKLNPSIPTDTRLKAGTPVRIPIF